MKNGTRIVLIVICFILIVFLVGVLIWGVTMRDFDYIGHLDVVKEEQFSSEGIDEIVIKASSADIHFYESDDNSIRVVEKAKKNIKEKYLFESSNQNGVLKISERSYSTFCIGFCFFNEIIYEVYLPASYDKKLTLGTASGDIVFHFEEINHLSDLSIVTVSGDIELRSKVNANAINIKSTSGDIETTYLNGPSISMKTTSGDIENDTVEGKKFRLYQFQEI